LAVKTDRLNQEALAASVPSWVPEVRFLAKTDSTNLDCLAWASEGAPEGCLVVADYQRAGKGRLGRSWFAPSGTSLLFTLILRPRIDTSQLALINLGAAVALCEAFAAQGVRASVKWPNDVNLGERKVAGILSEHDGGVVCLGVGVNVNVGSFPNGIAGTATSLKIHEGREFDRLPILIDFLGRFDLLYKDLPGRVPQEFRRWCSTLGAEVRVSLPERTLEGRAIDIDSAGALIMESGEVISAGDVVHLRQRGKELDQ
jgi:BirA family transcriptional regulator, biotin operon repressor / biotin---[acetyl-CoA-carboxylase] ligase